jgi:molybdopterin synthase catalytic subunit/molybdopterin converting factor small subunit
MLKDVVGRAEDALELDDGAQIGAVFQHYSQEFPRLRDLERSIVLARNHEFSPRSATLADGDEVALLPPVSGGASPYTREITTDRGFFALTREPIDKQTLSRTMLRGEDGALVAFEGVVRNNTRGRQTRRLDYECYEPMAVKVMAAIGCELLAGHQISHIAIVHRLGLMEVGETSIVILVAAAHRGPAFEAAREAIDRVKRRVPVWKKEYFADGEVWVEGDWDESVLPR